MKFFFVHMILSHSSTLAASLTTTKTSLREKKGSYDVKVVGKRVYRGTVQFNLGHTYQSRTLKPNLKQILV